MYVCDFVSLSVNLIKELKTPSVWNQSSRVGFTKYECIPYKLN